MFYVKIKKIFEDISFELNNFIYLSDLKIAFANFTDIFFLIAH
jgi:hypothetical protein